jgi:hypothetical protein
MQATVSGRILVFIGKLPQFTYYGDELDGVTRYADGTQYRLPDDEEARDAGMLLVRWQGNAQKTTVLPGSELAEIAIVDAIDYWISVYDFPSSERRRRIADLFRHFRVQTGCDTLFLEPNGREERYRRFLEDVGSNVTANFAADLVKWAVRLGG